MDGLEAVEITLSECKTIIDFRIDANTYKKDYVYTGKVLGLLNSSTIESQMQTIQNFGAYSLCNDINFVDDGVPFLMTKNVRHNYIEWSNIKFIDEKSHCMLHKSHCLKFQVLVTMAGEYLGRVAVYDKDDICSSNQAIAKITLKPEYNPYVISTFLNTRFGQNQINRFRTITGQPNINMALIKSLLVPYFSRGFSYKISKKIQDSNTIIEESQSNFYQAEQLLLAELGMEDFTPSKQSVAIKNYVESFCQSGRLDAEYYQPKYEAFKSMIAKYHNGTQTINSICSFRDKNYNPKDETTYKYVELSNIGNAGEITDCTIDQGRNLPSRARQLIKQGDIIVSSIEGSLSSCALVTNEYSGALCSTGFYVLNSDLINSETLLIMFKSIPLQNLLKKGCSGTILTAICKEELNSIQIPLINSSVQNAIAKKVKVSFELRLKSKDLLEKAKTAVETAIEQGEDAAFKWLSQDN